MPPGEAFSARSAFLIASQFCFTSSAPETATSGEHVRMPSHELGDDAIRDVVDGVPRAVVAFRRDLGVEDDLEQDVAQFLPQGTLITALQRLQRLVGLLQQVRCERLVGLLGVPRALGTQDLHGGHEIQQPGAGQVGRAAQHHRRRCTAAPARAARSSRAPASSPVPAPSPGPGRAAGQPDHWPGRLRGGRGERPRELPGDRLRIRAARPCGNANDLAGDPGLRERGKLRMVRVAAQHAGGPAQRVPRGQRQQARRDSRSSSPAASAGRSGGGTGARPRPSPPRPARAPPGPFSTTAIARRWRPGTPAPRRATACRGRPPPNPGCSSSCRTAG